MSAVDWKQAKENVWFIVSKYTVATAIVFAAGWAAGKFPI